MRRPWLQAKVTPLARERDSGNGTRDVVMTRVRVSESRSATVHWSWLGSETGQQRSGRGLVGVRAAWLGFGSARLRIPSVRRPWLRAKVTPLARERDSGDEFRAVAVTRVRRWGSGQRVSWHQHRCWRRGGACVDTRYSWDSVLDDGGGAYASASVAFCVHDRSLMSVS